MYFNARTRRYAASGSISDRTTARNFLSINYGWKVGSTSRTSVTPTPTAARAFSCDGRDTLERAPSRFREDGHDGYRRDDVQVGASVVGVSPELARVRRQNRNGAASSLEDGVFGAASSSNRNGGVGEDERRAEIRAR